ncbi:DUF1499 domain-containing protein [uncultured Parasphingorhabdus sp.]|uniref:DUF1499 domain-containing protein n=1 Tax=uncultured Parasphingorhabdus sp. TaxID=2709694 RepID=UPI002AA92D30|nr:DUF1499 domain-containing protein [uncultured Parasphingorhabdus sp.]
MSDQNEPVKPSKGETRAATASAMPGKLGSLRRDPKGWLILVLGLGAPLAFLIAAAGSGFGLWGWQAGLGAIPWIILVAVLTLLLAVIFIVLNRRKGRKTRWPLLGLGMVATLGFLAFWIPYVIAVATLPAIHDITTDLADPPQFTAIPLRDDNWDNIPGADDSDMRGMNPRQRWATVHQDAYPDIRSVRIDQPVAVVIEKAKRLAEDRGWEIVSVDPASGNLEATDTISLFRFKDDVVIRARSAENGAASIIDMRSVSRVGVHDIGANAKRVRRFLSDLSGTTTAASQ